MLAAKLGVLKPAEFENLVFDLVIASGFINVIWRTPGADGGRDIEASYVVTDASQYYLGEKWYIECKRYSSSIDWPTVHKKIAYADNHDADYLLLATNSNPSPSCESEAARWNNQRRNTKVRFWRGYDFERLLKRFPGVAAKYGLISNKLQAQTSLLVLSRELMHLFQTAYVSNELGIISNGALEVGAAISELLALKMDQLESYGKLVSSPRVAGALDFVWLNATGDLSQWPETELRAFLSACRYVTAAQEVTMLCVGRKAKVKMVNERLKLALAPARILAEIAFWSDFEFKVTGDDEIELLSRI